MAKEMDVSEEIPELSEVQSMKVADLKKKLKALGLPVTGNKTELVERLQDAYLSGKDISASSESDGFDSFDNAQLNFDGSQGTELEPEDCAETLMEESLLDQDQFSSFENSPLQTDTTKAHVAVDSNLNSTSVSKPLKKRAVVKSTNGATGVEKKVHLNRTNISFAELDSEFISTPKTVNKDESNTKKLSLKSLSESERLAIRAKRFNVKSAAKSNLKTENLTGNSSSVIPSGTSTAANLDVLKKRAQRFGQNVSTVMKQIEEKEKILKRKFKFGASVSVSATSTLDEQEKKRRRAERFGIS